MEDNTEILISLGASTAANCVPCFEYYYKKATAKGLRRDDIEKAVEIGNKVKTGSSIAMTKSMRSIMGCDGEANPQEESPTASPPCCK